MNQERISGQGAQDRRRFPVFAMVFFGIAVVAGACYIGFLCSETFSDLFNQRISWLIRGALAHMTSWIPCSLAECLLLLMPVLLIALTVYGSKRFTDSWWDLWIYCGSILSVGALLFSVFTFGFAPAYRGSRLDVKLGLTRRDVTAEELYDTALILTERLAAEQGNVVYSFATDFSIMPYNYSGMNDRLLAAYDDICDEYAFVPRLNSRIKPVMLSEAMSYTHITGVYTFFTGEANLNIAFPDYTLPYTAAHELAHQRGIAREDEANFMAFLVCQSSEDAYVRYSGYMNLLEHVLSALYTASPTLYRQACLSLPSGVIREMNAFSDFFEPYRDSVASDVSGTVNNTFLTMHGTEGTRSYGMVVDLAVAYFAED